MELQLVRRNRVVLVVFFLAFGQMLQAQSYRAFMKAGEEAFRIQDFHTAMSYYAQALAKKKDNLKATYQYAETARHIYAYEVALDHYQKIKEAEAEEKFPLLYLRIGQAQKSLGRYEAAITSFEEFIQGGHGKEPDKQLAKQELANCRWALELIAEPTKLEVQHLNRRVNTPYSEFGPLLKGDTLFYSSYRYTWNKDEHDPKRKLSKVLRSIGGSRGRPVTRGFNERDKITAHLSIGRDGTRYFTLCEYVTSTQIQCAIYSTKRDRRGRWTKPKKLGAEVNLTGSTNTQPCLAFDRDREKEILFFSSDRPGGKGGMDIYWTWKDESGEFLPPLNLEVVNTPGDEITPFFYEPIQQLSFSSNGLRNMGGYDIYFADKSGEQWEDPVHGGYPLNSSYNDIYFTRGSDSTVAYLASNREGAFFLDKENKSCCNDIFKVTYQETAAIDSMPRPDTPALAGVDSTLLDIDPLVSDPLLEQPDEIPTLSPPERLEDFLPLALYFDNDEPDKRTRRTTTQKSYGQTFLSYYPRKYEFIDNYTDPLEEAEKEEAAGELDLFFEEKVKLGNDYLRLFSEILLKRLREGEKVEIFIKGFTSPRAKSNYNLALGKRRVSSVKNHFRKFKDGIFLPFIKSGQLVLTERSFGETTAAASISDELEDRRNSIYSVEASVERRVEIVEIKRSMND